MPDVRVTILSLPLDGGSPIIRVDYRVDGGPAVDSGLSSPFIGSFIVPEGTGKQIEWRAVNIIDDDPDNWSSSKIVFDPPNVSIPDQFFALTSPRALNVQDYNTGGPITDLTSDYGSVSGTVITFPEAEVDQTVNVLASNPSGGSSDSFRLEILDTGQFVPTGVVSNRITFTDSYVPQLGSTLNIVFDVRIPTAYSPDATPDTLIGRTNNLTASQADQAWQVRIHTDGAIRFQWRDGVGQSIVQTTEYPRDSWFRVRCLYNGTTGRILIEEIEKDALEAVYDPALIQQVLVLGNVDGGLEGSPEGVQIRNINVEEMGETTINYSSGYNPQEPLVMPNAGTSGPGVVSDAAMWQVQGTSVPWVKNPMPDATIELDQGSFSINLDTVFGNADTFEVTGQLASINGRVLEIDDNIVVTDEVITVTATNPNGTAQDSFLLTVKRSDVQLVSPIPDQSIVQNGGEITIDLRPRFINETSFEVVGVGASLDPDGFTLRLSDADLLTDEVITYSGINDVSRVDDTFNFSVTASDTVKPVLLNAYTSTDGTEFFNVFSKSLSLPIDGNTWEPVYGNWADLGGVAVFNRLETTSQPNDTVVLALNPAMKGTEPPAAMAAPSLVVDSGTQITATFAADPNNGGSVLTSYDLRYSTDEATWTTLTDETSPVVIGGLLGSQLYYVQTRANNAVGNGTWSESQTATTEAPGGGGSIIGTTGNPTITNGVSFAGRIGTTYEWLNDGSFETDGPVDLWYLVVAGGGAGGDASRRGGGGGAGGVVGGGAGDSILSGTGVHAVNVGAGGASIGASGENSEILEPGAGPLVPVAIGGGGGGDGVTGASGGSGGGGTGDGFAGGSGTGEQGFAGGSGNPAPDAGNNTWCGGGGGGAGEVGADGFGIANDVGTDRAGDGGDGIESSITGSAVYYGGGGGGSVLNNSSTTRRIGLGGLGGGGDGGAPSGSGTVLPQNGTDGLGGGGGGGRLQTPEFGAGGSGVVIIFVED